MAHLFCLHLLIHRRDTAIVPPHRLAGNSVRECTPRPKHPPITAPVLWMTLQRGVSRDRAEGVMFLKSQPHDVVDSSARQGRKDAGHCGHRLGPGQRASGCSWTRYPLFSCTRSPLTLPGTEPPHAEAEYLQLLKLVPHPLLSSLKHALGYLPLHPSSDDILHSLTGFPASDLSCL